LGDIPCIPQLLEDGLYTPAQLRASGRALWGASWKTSWPVSGLSLLKSFLSDAYAKNAAFRPLVVGGDHSTSWAVTEALHAGGYFPKLAVLHFDAHTDLLETRYGVDHCFATWAAHAALRMRASERSNFVQVGVRVSGRSKAHWQKKYGLRQLWAKEVIGRDPRAFAESLVASWKKNGCERLYVSFDVDALDPTFVPSTGTAEPGGLDPSWCAKVIEICSKEMLLVTADIVELAPVLGSRSDAKRSTRHSARIADELLKGLVRGL
jgi:agmatinase